MDFINKWGPAILGIISTVIGGGTGGLLVGGIAGVVAFVVGLLLRNVIKNWQMDNAHKQSEEQAAKDHAKIIKEQQEQAAINQKAHEQSKKDKENAFEGGAL